MARRLIRSTPAGQALSVVACCLAFVAGCNGTATPAPPAGGSRPESVQPAEPPGPSPVGDDAGDSAGGDGSGAGGNQAAGSPIDVPTIPEQHQPMDGLRDAIQGAFVTACGGQDLCVQLQYGDGPCLKGYDPADHAARGSTVKVLTESQEDCDRASGPAATTDGSQTSTDVPSSGTSDPSTDVPSSGPTGSGTDGSGGDGSGTGDGSPDNGQPDGSSG